VSAAQSVSASVVDPTAGQLKYGFGGASDLRGASFLAVSAAFAFGSFVIQHILEIRATVWRPLNRAMCAARFAEHEHQAFPGDTRANCSRLD
jgi:hypothetical protein